MDEYNRISKQIEDAQKNYATTRDAKIGELKTSYGYDDRIKSLDSIRKSVAENEGMLESLPENVRQRTAGSLMTNAQLQRRTAAEQNPLITALSSLSRNQGVQQQGLNDIDAQLKDAMNTMYQDYTGNLNNLFDTRNKAFDKYKMDYDAQQQEYNRAAQLRQFQLQKEIEDNRNRLTKEMYDATNARDTTLSDLQKRILELQNGGSQTIQPVNANSADNLQNTLLPGLTSALGMITPKATPQSWSQTRQGIDSNLINSLKSSFLADPIRRIGDLANAFYGKNVLPGFTRY